MSIVFAFANKKSGCIATDSQRIELTTGKVEYNAIKSRRISKDIVVGYAGHSEPCEAIVKEATKSFLIQNNKLAWKFALLLEKAQNDFSKKYYNNSGGDFFLNFLTVGPNGDRAMMILIYGTVTGYQLLSPAQSELPIQFSFIPPSDVDREICTKIAIESIKESAPGYSLEEIADRAVQRVIGLSQWCGGKTQILTVGSRPHQ